MLKQEFPGILVVKPQVIPSIPRRYSQPEARPDLFKNVRRSPAAGVLAARDVAIGLTPIDLCSAAAKGKTAYRSPKLCFSRVETAFAKKKKDQWDG